MSAWPSRWLLHVLLPVVSFMPCAALAQGITAPNGSLSPQDARAWITRIEAAARGGNWQGTLVYGTGGAVATSRVWHYVIGADTFERLDAQDGRQQRIVRHNDTVHTLWPQTLTAVIEKRETLAAWGTTPQAVNALALEQYEIKGEGAGRVAGRDAAVLLLEPRDLLRHAQRLWADLASGLMLRADVLAPGLPRAVLESTAFTEVEIGVRPQPDRVLQVLRKLDGWQVHRSQQKRTTPDSEGWVLARPVPGFQLAGAVRRGMDSAASVAGEGEPVLHAVFSDGLAHVSVFIEPFRPQRHRGEVQARQGATATLMQQQGEHWVTVVGDVPPGALKQFATAFERKRP